MHNNIRELLIYGLCFVLHKACAMRLLGFEYLIQPLHVVVALQVLRGKTNGI